MSTEPLRSLPSVAPPVRAHPRSGSAVVGLMAGALAAAALLPTAHATTAATTAATAATAADSPPLTLQPCRLRGVPTEVLCGWLPRPLDPAAPQGPQIRIHVAVLPALARNKRPDPVVLLAGGPGQSAIALADMVLARHRALNRRRDIVLVDQRGTGESAPLTCPDERHLPMAEALDATAALRRLAACRDALSRLPHGDLRHYTTAVAMQDLDAVRQALGIAQWNLVGGSYGTRAGLDYQRQFPQAVRRSVLDGVAPPDMVLPAAIGPDSQAALDGLLRACEAEPACRQAFPQLAAQWQRLLASLPRSVALRHPLTGQASQVTLTRALVLRAVRAPLYAPALSSGLPAAIQAAAQGQFDALGGLASGLSGGRPALQLAMGMHHAVVCNEDLPRLAAAPPPATAVNTPPATAAGAGTTPAPVARDFGDGDLRQYQAACQGWPQATVPAAFYQVPPARQPVWLLSGGADPVTPPRHAERTAQALGSQARHLVVPAAGHGVLALACVRTAVHAFIDAATDTEALAVAAAADCAQGLPRALAFVPPDPARTPAKSTPEATR